MLTVRLAGVALSAGAAVLWLRAPEVDILPDTYKELRGYELEPEEDLEREEQVDFLEYINIQNTPPDGQLQTREEIAAEYAGTPVMQDLLESEHPELVELANLHHQAAAKDLSLPMVCARRKRATFRTRAFLRHWVARVRIQFPLRADRPSDRAAMLKWLGMEMRGHGIRYAHVENCAEIVVNLALLPSRSLSVAHAVSEEVRSRTRIGRWWYTLSSRIFGHRALRADGTVRC